MSVRKTLATFGHDERPVAAASALLGEPAVLDAVFISPESGYSAAVTARSAGARPIGRRERAQAAREAKELARAAKLQAQAEKAAAAAAAKQPAPAAQAPKQPAPPKPPAPAPATTSPKPAASAPAAQQPSTTTAPAPAPPPAGQVAAPAPRPNPQAARPTVTPAPQQPAAPSTRPPAIPPPARTAAPVAPAGPQPVPATALPGQSLGSDPPIDLGVIKAIVGDGLTLTWPESSLRIAVADDTIASLRLVSRREVVVNGLKTGRTSVFVWFADGRRVFYRLIVTPNYEAARTALRDLSPSIILDPGADEDTVVLRGEVASESVARQARSLAEQLLPRSKGAKPEPPRIVNLLRYASGLGTADDRLDDAMRAVDPRIKVRRIQRGVDPDPAVDSYVLEGQVKDVNALVQAVVLADRQLGGNGKTVKAADADRVMFQRNSSGGSLYGFGGTGNGFGSANALQALQQTTPPQSGLSAQLARGLLVTSESGKVVSFLRVDSLPQVLVGIRVMQVDRGKARRLGVDLRFDNSSTGVRTSVVPGAGALGDARATTNTVTGNALPSFGNVVGTFVHDTFGISAALDLLSEKRAARSVAEPNILTMSGEQASVMVGGEVPVPGSVSTAVAVQTGFSFQGFGVRLDIRPTLDDQGVVTLEVAPSIVTPSSTLGNGAVPGFQIQRVETTARVKAGESLVLGGLLSASSSVESRGITGLTWLPFFRSTRRSSDSTELVFVITPRVIGQSSTAVSLPPLEFRDSPNYLGSTGLDAAGVPFTFSGIPATVLGKSGFCLELRQAPNSESSALTDCLLPDTEVIVVGSEDDWLHVHAPSGQDGWAQRRWLHLVTEKKK